MANTTIDVLFRFKQVGDDIISKLKQGLKEAEASFKTSMSMDISIPTDSVTKQIEDIKKSLQEGMQKTAKNTEIAFQNSGNKIVTTAEQQTHHFVAFTSSLIMGGLSYISVQFFAAFNAIDSMSKATFLSMKVVGIHTLDNFVARGKNITSFGNSIYSLLSSGNQKLLTAWNIFKNITVNLSGIVSTMWISNMFMSNALEFLKKAIGKGEEALNPLQRASRLVTSIDTSLHSSTRLLGLGLKTISFGLASIWGPFSGIITGLATANVFTNLISRRLAPGRMQLAAFFGSSRAEISLIITSVKDFMYELVKVNPFKAFLGMRPKSILQELLDVIRKIIFVVNRIDLKTLMSFMNKFTDKGKQGEGIIKRISSLFSSEVSMAKRVAESSLGKIKDSAKSIGSGVKNYFSDLGKIKGPGKSAAKIEKGEITSPIIKPSILEKMSPKLMESFLLSLSKIEDRSKGINSAFLNLGHAVENPFISAEKAIKGMVKALEGLSKKTKDPLISLFLQEIKSHSIEVGKSFDKDLVGKLLSALEKIEGKGIGGKLSHLIASGIKNAEPGAIEAMKALALVVSSSFVKNSSLEKVAGKKIDQQVAQGIEQNKKVVGKAMDNVAEEAMKRLPRSPAEVGPLRALTMSGFKIPLQLAQGIESGMNSLTSIVDTLAENVVKHLRPAIDMSHMADRMNIPIEQLSLLEYALSDLGVTGNDLQILFQNFSKVLNETATPEQVALYQKLGLNLDEIRRSTNPALNLYRSISKSLSNIPPESELARKAMENFGIMAGSNMYLAVRKSTEELDGLMQEGAKLGTFWTDEFAKSAKEVNSFWERIKKLKDYIFKEFLASLLPMISEISEGLFQFLKEQNNNIRVVTKRIGDAIFSIYTIVKELFKLFQVDSDKAFEIVSTMLFQIVQFIGVFIGNVFDTFYDRIVKLIKETLSGISGIVVAWLSYIWSTIGNTVKIKFAENVTIPLKEMIVDALSKIEDNPAIQKILHVFYGIDAAIFAKKFRESLKTEIEKTRSDLNKEASDTSNDFISAALAIEKKTKEAFKNIASISSDAFSKKQLTSFFETIKFEWNLVMSEIKKSSAGTAIFDELTKLEKAFSEGGFEKAKKEIQKMSNAVANSLLPAIKKTGEAFQAIPEQTLEALEKQKKSLELHSFEVQTILADANERGYKSKLFAHERELLQTQKKHEEEIRRLIELNATKAQIDSARFAQEMEISKLSKQHKKEKDDQEKQDLLATVDSIATYIQTNARTLGTMMDDLYALSGEKVKEFFYISKAAAIAESIMNTAQGVTKALAEGGVWGIAQGAIVAAAGTVQVAKIMAETLGFRTGGKIPGSGSGDIVPIRAEPGEFMNSKPSVDYYGPGLFEALNRKLIPKEMFENLSRSSYNPVAQVPKTAFQAGGYIQRDSGKQSGQNANINIINVDDPYKFERSLNTSRGAKTMLNFMNNNKREITKNLA